MTLDEGILELLSRWDDLRERGETPTAEDLCRDCPDLLPEVKRRLEHLQRLERLLPSTAESKSRDPVPQGCEEGNGASLSAPAGSTSGAMRYHPLRFHARGGLGEVFVAQDEELHREVALKRMRPGRIHDAESRRRFLLEAQITGRLEHPGIVPVHGLMQDKDGQPCYAMRFIQGETLQQAIDHFHAADKPGRDPGERSLALRQLLAHFIAVCNTMAYAHSRGVLHRDLKPANIMLGKYGETLVVDWGLAKPFERDEAAHAGGEQSVAPRPAGEESSTQIGEVIGTPAYMSPEQAAGQWDVVWPASDIYSLGATLYTLLTGQASPEGSLLHEVLDRVKRGDFPPPRQRKKDLAPALEAICLKAMARRPEARYATALDLAADVEHWLADEPVAAYREALPARLGRWTRRHRAWAAGAVALLLTAVVALAGGLLAVNHQKRLKEQALAAQSQARQRARQALEAMSSQVIDKLLSKQGTKLEPAQEEFLKQALQYYQEFAAEAGDSAEVREGAMNAHLRVGNICRRLGQHQAAEEAYRQAIAAGEHLAAAFPAVPEYRHNLARGQNNLGVLLATTGRPRGAEAACRDALASRKLLADHFPTILEYRLEVAESQTNLGNLLADTGQPREAESAYGDAVATLTKLVADCPTVPEYRQKLAASQNNLGVLLMNTNRPKEAEAAYRDAIAAQRQLAAEFPAVPEHRQYLARSQISLGFLFANTDRPVEAEAAYRDALAHLKQLAAVSPTVPQYRQEVAISQNNLGVLLADTGRLTEAEAAYRDALATRKQLAADFPTVPDYQDDLAATMVSLADLLCQRRDFLAARSFLEDALRHHQAALQANPANPTSRRFYRKNRTVLVRTLAGLGELAAALATAEQLARLGWDPAGDAYDAACALAQSVAVVEREDLLPEAKRAAQTQAYADRALDLLRQAIAKGYKDVSHMKKDTDLDSLRQREDFQKLLDDLEKARPGTN